MMKRIDEKVTEIMILIIELMHPFRLVVVFLTVLSVVVLLSPRVTIAQDITRQDLSTYRESLVFEVNNEILVPGENLLLALSCYQNGAPSSVSKVAYIELINNTNLSVLKQQVALVNGLGSAAMYLPSYLKTGSYTVIAYTRWMKNFSRSIIHQKPVRIINPYESLPVDLFDPEVDLTLSTTLYPHGGRYRLNTDQKVSFWITDQFGRGVSAQSRITDPDGNTVAEFESAASGKGSFTFKPQREDGYRIVMVDQKQNVHFQKLELTRIGGTSLTINETEDQFEILADTDLPGSQPEVIEVWSNGDLVDSKVLNKNGLYFNKSQLPKGVNILRSTTNEGATSYEQAFFNRPQKVGLETKLSVRQTGPRKRVVLKLESEEPTDIGLLTVSVKKLIPGENHRSYLGDYFGTSPLPDSWLLSKQTLPSSDQLASVNQYFYQPFDNGPKYLPDLWGSLITGIAIDESSKPLEGQQISLTVSSGLQFSLTDNNGRFYFHTKPSAISEEHFFSTRGTNGQLSLSIDNPFLIDHSFVEVAPFCVNEELESWLIQKSIEVQVENAYYQIKNITSETVLDDNVFEFMKPKTYMLDDFTRFPQMKDPIREYVDGVGFRQDKGVPRLVLPYVDNKSGYADSVLTLLNGIPVTVQFILDLNPNDIESIDVYGKQVNISTAEFRGVVDFRTYEDRFENIGPEGQFKRVDYESTSPYKQLTGPQYVGDSLKRIPDFRSQLVWEPHLKMNGEPLTIEFFTSDSPGIYDVTVSGITDDDRYWYETTQFEVRE